MEQKNTMHGSPEVSSISDLIKAPEHDTHLGSRYFRAGEWINDRIRKKQEPSGIEMLSHPLIMDVLVNTVAQYEERFRHKGREVTGFYRSRPLDLKTLLRDA